MASSADSFTVIESQLASLLSDIAGSFQADALTLHAGLAYGVDDAVRDAVESIDPKLDRLVVLLETDGGSIDVAERIANTFRHFYQEVDFVVPNFAYSAGTILAMSGDNIHMDYYSVLGPIDPQVRKDGVGWVPALGYLLKYNELVEKSRNGDLTDVEVALLVNRFDPAELHRFEQAKEQTITLLKQWLVQYKFKDWDTTATQGIAVDQNMKQARAAEIAEKLNKTELWHSHSRGIPMKVLVDVVNLKIEDFGADQTKREGIRSYCKLMSDYMQRREYEGVTHTRNGISRLR